MIGKKVRFHSGTHYSKCEGVVQEEGATKGVYKVNVTAIEADGKMISSSFMDVFGLNQVIALEEELELIE
ncbi:MULTISPECIES: hypothetical protein [unclassified Psychrobacillus]|uniref:hypothetical protein n=1 Tax=unclassified Psychrobacillus TaxID=2636677 RepID=UPI0030FC1E11